MLRKQPAKLKVDFDDLLNADHKAYIEKELKYEEMRRS